ncbi:MAG: S8 family serine peptidase [bacterium]
MSHPQRLLSCLAVALATLSGASCNAKDTCGNSTLEQGESCDGSTMGGASCQTLGYTTGTLRCTDQCLFDLSDCEGLVSCGDDVLDPGEQCDGDDLGGETCESRNLGAGALRCDPVTCQFDGADCEGRGICGDGVADGDEECDGDDLGDASCSSVDATFVGGALECAPDCTLQTGRCYGEPEFPIGRPCEAHEDCPGGWCWQEISERHYGPPGGYCIEMCAGDDSCPLAGAAGLCVALPNSPRLCFRRCTLGASDCRPGYACQMSGDQTYCFPRCTDDSQCLISGDCDTESMSEQNGFCITPEEYCTGGIDEDFDGLIDCSDPDCTGKTGCPEGEICLNGIDDDGDGYVDCDDAECGQHGPCTGAVCTPAPGAVLTCGSVLTGESNNAAGSTSVITDANCVGPDGGPGPAFTSETGPEYTYTLTVSTPQVVTIDVTGFSDDLDVYIIKQTGGQYCDPNNGCFAFGGNPPGQDESVTFAAYPAMTYYVVVEGYDGTISSYDLAVTCDATGYEDCANGVDDDGDGLADCNDPECFYLPPACSP